MAYKYKLGIDFGTTNSSIALKFDDDHKGMKPVLFSVDNYNRDNTKIHPSLVFIDEDGNTATGCEARELSSECEIEYELIKQIKMKLDVDHKGEDFLYKKIGGTEYYASDIIAMILRNMMKRIEKKIPVNIDGIVFGHPVDYNDRSKHVMIKAAYKAGIFKSEAEAKEKTSFVAEPIAVALNYGTDLQNEKCVFVFDFGGGTLDVAVMKLRIQNEEDRFASLPHEAVAKARYSKAGEAFTESFFKIGFLDNYGLDNFLDAFHIDEDMDEDELWDYLNKNNEGIKFIQELDRVKCLLSSEESFVLRFNETDADGVRYNITQELTAEDFEDSISEYFDDIRDTIDECMKNARRQMKITVDEVDEVLLAGGSSTIPCIMKIVKEYFGEEKVVEPTENQQMESIVRGLAEAGLCEKDHVLFEDIVESDYGIMDNETNKIVKIITKGTKVSDTQFDEWTMTGGMSKTFEALGDDAPYIQIYQNSDMLSEVRLPEHGGGKYKIYFKVDEDKGWLSVHVLNKLTGEWMKGDHDFDGNDCVYFTDDL